MTKHYKIKEQTIVYHIEHNLTIGGSFPTPHHARAFLNTIPAQCDVPDIKDNEALKAVLKDHRTNYVKPVQIEFYTKPYNNGRTTVPEAFYYGYIEEIAPEYGIVKLDYRGNSKREWDCQYNGLWLCVHLPTYYTIGIDTAPNVKQQIKLWQQMKFTHKGDGLFVSGCGKYKTQSSNKVTILV
jgi:hypothetical protein